MATDDRRQGDAQQAQPYFGGTSDGTGNGADQPTPANYGGNDPNNATPPGSPGFAGDMTHDGQGGANNTGGGSNAGGGQNNAGGGQSAAPPADSGDNAGGGASTGDGSGGGTQAGDNSGAGAQPPDNSGGGTQTGDNSGSSAQPPDSSGDGTQTGDNSGSGTPTGGDTGGTSTGDGGGILQSADGLIPDVVHTVDDLAGNVLTSATGLLDGVVNTADGLAGSGMGGGTGLVDGGIAATQSLLGNVVNTADGLVTNAVNTVDGLAGDGVAGGNGLLGDIVQTANDVVTDASHATGLDGSGNGLIGDIGGATGTGGLINDVVNVANSGLDGSVGAGTGSDGSNPSILANLTDDGSVGHLANDVGGIVTGDLAGTGLTGNGPIANASLLPEGNGILGNGATATVNDPSQPGPLVDLDAISNGQNGSSQNLINADALNQANGPSVLANVFSSGDGSGSNVTGHVIDLGPDGHTAADANVLTSPDQFQFASLGGTGADSLVGSLTDATAPATGDAGLPVVTAPSLDLGGDQPLVDVNLTGDADTQHNILSPLQQGHPLGIV